MKIKVSIVKEVTYDLDDPDTLKKFEESITDGLEEASEDYNDVAEGDVEAALKDPEALKDAAQDVFEVELVAVDFDITVE